MHRDHNKKEEKEEAPEVERSRATHTEDDQGSSIGMPIIPVKLYPSDNPGRCIIVYAMLDICSTSCFILQETLDQLEEEVEGGVTVAVKTVNGKKTSRKNYIKKERLSVASISTSQNSEPVKLPKLYCEESLPVEHDEIITIDSLRKWSHLHRMENEIENYKDDIPIALIIGGNCPKVHEPLDCIPSQDNGPFATRTSLGWCVVGPFRRKPSEDVSCHRIIVQDVATNKPAKHSFVPSIRDITIAEQLQEMYLNDFNEKESEKKGLSVEDCTFLEIMKNEGRLTGNHHCLPLPFRNSQLELPNNKTMVVKRLKSVKNKMSRNEEYRDNYNAFMTNLFAKGYARKVDHGKQVPEGRLWYVPHHGVYHPKTGKFRVVMDCSAEYAGRSLNGELLQGPDTTNLLLGVLLRFRQHKVPFMGDLEQMFFQINVPEEQRSFLRFLWWPDGNIEVEAEECEMCVHLFGAIFSPSIAGYALRKTAADSVPSHGEAAANAVLKNFYVDDFCRSERTDDEACDIIDAVDSVCATGGFNLTKMVSSSRQVLDRIPLEKRSKNYQNCDLSKMGLQAERALGVVWNVESDTLGFRVQFQDKPLCRKVVLADVTSAYDPDGRGSAFILPGKKILQEITAQKKDWDDPISDVHKKQWDEWKSNMMLLRDVATRRCFIPPDFGEPVSRSLHCFSDASSVGYGQVSYLRSVHAEGAIYVSQVTAKSRVAPLKSFTIPCLELTAATVSVKVAALLKEELDFEEIPVTYWTDSSIVLGYINNDCKRFRTYVANRLNLVHSYSEKHQWRHVGTDDNPADYASRGLSPKSKEKVKVWFDGPDFLWRGEECWPENIVATVDEDDEEAKPVSIAVHKTTVSEGMDVFTDLEDRYSSWFRLVRVVAHIVRFVKAIKEKVKSKREGNWLV